ncbi:MAG TPA: ribonuclease P protein component [Patescibacteria group bacterium]|jgi:ribonuclease P protein component|nr:ribonuclease P protein component [Patescibacteria group bacterium]
MLSQKHRLSKSADVKKTTARGRSFFNPFFVLKIVPGDEPAKLTVITSVKVSKRAVDRNRLKRIIREAVRPLISKFKPGNYAVLVKSSALKITPTELREQVMKSLNSSKTLN